MENSAFLLSTQKKYLLYALLLLPSLLFPFASILRHFLYNGAYVLDSGWFAFLLSQGDLTLKNPAVIGEHSYFSTHISPTFIVASFFSKLLGLKPHIAMALWQTLIFSSFYFAAVIFTRSILNGLTTRSLALVCVVVCFVPFSGLSLAILGYPHTEAMGMGLAFLTIALLTVEARWSQVVSWVLLILAWGVREDVGFHVFALIMSYLTLSLISKQRPPHWRRFLTAAILSLGYSIIAVKIQKHFYVDDDAFSRIYSGQPPWSHLSLDFALKRIEFFIVERAYISWPIVVAMVCAAVMRSLLVLTPVLAFAPWLILNLVASADSAGTLMGYYAYPLLALFMWPLFLAQQSGSQPSKAFTLVVLAFALLLSSWFKAGSLKLLNPVHFRLLFNGSYEMRSCQAETFLAQSDGIATIMDPSFAALFPERYARRTVFFPPEETKDKDYVLLWRNSFGAGLFTNSVFGQEQFVKVFEDGTTFSVWRNKSGSASEVDWSSLFAKCGS